MTNTRTASSSPVSISEIVRDDLLQVRKKLDRATVNKYAEQMLAGAAFPPVTVARINGELFLLDGWHRMSAAECIEAREIDAVVTNMSRQDAIWEAARANLTHGLPLKKTEQREVFRAYVRSGRHNHGGKYKSYREIAKELGGLAQYTTIRSWMEKDFRRVFNSMSGHGGTSNPAAGPPKVDL